MFTKPAKMSAAVVAGVALAGGMLVAPGVVAAPVMGRAAAWGYNAYGQLGDGTTTGSTVPVAVDTAGALAGKSLTAISSGTIHTCALAGGRAYCWGNNGNGQLGNGSTTPSKVPVAVDISDVLKQRTVTAISAGYNHTCAVADGKAVCWGQNDYGQLGNDSLVDSSLPVAVDTSDVLKDRTVTAISAGYSHTCAVADGRAACWGFNSAGQLGNNSETNSPVPVSVDTSDVLKDRTVTEIEAGTLHSCAVADGRAACWGLNSSGQLGDGSTTRRWVPVAAAGDMKGRTAVTAISAGGDHTCAVADAIAFCWGFNGGGQLGDTSFDNSSEPVAVDTAGVLAGRKVTAISAGGSHTSAISAAAPQPPTGVAGVASDGRVTVSWNAPADDGGAVIEEYTATAAPGGATCTTGTISCTVTGLANGTAYTFTVTARNAIGVSPPSAPSAAVTPQAPTSPPPPTQPPTQPSPQAPAKVTGVKATVGKGSVKITWKPVTGATSYRARISEPGGKEYQAWKTTAKRVFKAKVKKGKKYRFQVRALGAGGLGPVTTLRFKGK